MHRTVCVRDIPFLTARTPFYVFLLLSLSTPPPPTFQGMCLRNGPYKNVDIAMVGTLCDDIMRKRLKIGKSHTI